MGAVALSNRVRGVTHDGRRFVEATVTFSGSYATGGDTLALTALGMSEVRRIEVLEQTNMAGWQVEPVTTDPKAPKLKLVRRTDAGASTEAGAAYAGGAHTAKVRFVGS